jgi:hypothetical protein
MLQEAIEKGDYARSCTIGQQTNSIAGIFAAETRSAQRMFRRPDLPSKFLPDSHNFCSKVLAA